MKYIYIFVSLLLGILYFSAQETKTLWQKDIESLTQDFLSGLSITIDGYILLSGSSINSKFPEPSTSNQQNVSYDYHVIKLDQQGNIIWNKYFGGTSHDYLSSLIATNEGGFLLSGTSNSNYSGDKKENNLGGSDVWIIRLNEKGEELWQRTLGTKSNDESSSVVQSIDMGFFIAGNIKDNKNLFGSKDVFISKLDKDGKLIHTTILGGDSLDEVTDMIPTPDGGVVLLVYTTSGKTENFNNPNISNYQNNNTNIQNENIVDGIIPTVKTFIGKYESNFGNGDYWIVKLDKNANIEWQKSYGGVGDDHPKKIICTEKGYLVAGESQSQLSGNKKENLEEGTDLWLINLDKRGNDIWQKNYSFGNRDVMMSLDVIRKTKNNISEDRGFLLGGYTQSEEKIKLNDEKFWMLYIDTNGNEEWRKYVEGKSKKKEERLVSVLMDKEGDFVLAGTSTDKFGEENWKIVKLGDKQVEELIEEQDISIYPNPVEEYCYVEIGKSVWKNDGDNEAEIVLYDMSRRKVRSLKTKQKITKVDISILPQGVYIVTVNVGSKNVISKLVKK